MEYIKIKDILEFKKKSKIKASEGLKIGKYNFYTSSKEQNKFLDYYEYSNEALIIGTGGNANIHYSYGKFSVSTDCFVLENKDNKNFSIGYIYKYLLKNIHILENGFRGAGLKHVSKEYLENIEIPIISLEKQKKLIKNLRSIHIFIDKNKQLKNKLNFLTKSLFTKYSNSKVAKSFYIKDISSELFAGGDKPNDYSENISKEYMYPVYSNGEKKEGLLCFSKTFKVDKEALTISARGTIGFTTIRKAYFTPVVRLITLIPNKNNNIIYLKFAIGELNLKKLGSGVAQLTIPVFSKYKLNLPPIELQNKFAERVEKIEKLSFMCIEVIIMYRIY